VSDWASLALDHDAHPSECDDAGVLKRHEAAMFKNVLIAIDGSDLAEKALSTGLTLAKSLGAKVTVATVTEPWVDLVSGEATLAFPFDDYQKVMAANAAEILGKAEQTARSIGVSISPVHVKERHPAEGILETATSTGADLIVVASHGRRGLKRILLGSQANQVVTHSAVPVLVCR
jgi:nucleotide-binding universal stress UspA family protein